MADQEDAITLPGDCPPAEAEPREGQFYRLARKGRNVGDATVPEEDWLMPYDTRGGECYGDRACCKCHAWSVIEVLDDIVQARNISPWARQKSVAEFQLALTMGLVRADKTEEFNSHCDWWPTDRSAPPVGTIVLAAAIEADTGAAPS